MKAGSILVALLISRGLAYTWTPVGPPGLNTHDWCALSSGAFSSVLCADSCVVLEGVGEWETYSHGGLPCRGACPLDSTAILLIMGEGAGADGIYQFHFEDHGFAPVYACPFPQFIHHTAFWNAYVAGSAAGLALSTNAVDWLAMDAPAVLAAYASASCESCMVLAADTAVFYADHATAMQFGSRIDLGLVEHGAIDEASGIAASRRNPGVLWTHNDSGNPNVIYALSDDGTHLGAYTVAGAANRDWEDMAIGYNTTADRYLLYIADFGDNNGVYEDKYIYMIEEPSVSPSQPPVAETIYGVERITFRYPSGVRYNAETLLVDSPTGDLFVVTKQAGGIARVFRAAYPQSTSETMVLEQVAELSDLGGAAVGGDVSASGREILIKTYGQIFHWARSPGESVDEAFGSSRTPLPYVQEPQGEAVCWMPNLMGYYTVSEEPGGTPARLYGYRRQPWQQATPVPLLVTDIAIVAGGGLLAVESSTGFAAGLWESEDHGATWTHVLGAPGLRAAVADSHGVVFTGWREPGDTAGVAVWTREIGLLTPVNQGLPSLGVNRLRMDPRDSLGSVICCTDSGAARLTGYFEPMELRVGHTMPDTVRIQWLPVPAATLYDIYRSAAAFYWCDSLLWHTVAPPETALLITEDAVIPDTACFFRGRARNASYVTPWGTIVGLVNRSLP
ncbi:hypothetical protein JXA88_12980 [Candidatus Fermentibacteria bacterium]|nr:hypothetical protein [Candidatus Fermentibacteria bacterium]